MNWLVSGVSSSGKSSYISSCSFKDVCGFVPNDQNVLLAYQLGSFNVINDNSVVHYNICRSIQKKYKFSLKYQLKRRLGLKPINYQIDDPILENVEAVDLQVIILIVTKDELLRRINKRQNVETESWTSINVEGYDRKYWLRFYQEVDLYHLYNSWLSNLEEKGLKYTLLDSTDRNYKQIYSKGYLKEFLR